MRAVYSATLFVSLPSTPDSRSGARPGTAMTTAYAASRVAPRGPVDVDDGRVVAHAAPAIMVSGRRLYPGPAEDSMADFDRVLVLETAGKVGQAALAADGVVIAEATLGEERRRGSDLALVVDRLLREASWKPGSLSSVVVGLGPGSYTGLRVGLASLRHWPTRSAPSSSGWRHSRPSRRGPRTGRSRSSPMLFRSSSRTYQRREIAQTDWATGSGRGHRMVGGITAEHSYRPRRLIGRESADWRRSSRTTTNRRTCDSR